MSEAGLLPRSSVMSSNRLATFHLGGLPGFVCLVVVIENVTEPYSAPLLAKDTVPVLVQMVPLVVFVQVKSALVTTTVKSGKGVYNAMANGLSEDTCAHRVLVAKSGAGE